MGYKHINSKGQAYWLHTRKSPNGADLFFFSKIEEGSIELPERLEVFESPRSHLPMVRKK